MGRRIKQTKNSANSYWSEALYHSLDQTAPPSVAPSVTTDSVDFGFAANATAHGTVSSQGSVALTQYGFVWGSTENPTVEEDNVSVVGTNSFTGAFTKNVNGLPPEETVYFRAFATNAVGTSYGANISGMAFLCLAAGTLISTARGCKRIEEIGYEDNILCWNFDEAKLAYEKPIWMVKPFQYDYYGVVKFSNGTELRTVPDGKGHRIFNYDSGQFTYMMSEATPLGCRTITEENKRITTAGKRIQKGKTTFYNIITRNHINVYANGILTSTGLNNLYPISNMKYVKECREIVKNDFGISDEIFHGLRIYEQKDYPNLRNKLKTMTDRQLFCG